MFYILKEKYSKAELFDIYAEKVGELSYCDKDFAAYTRNHKNLVLEKRLKFALECDFTLDLAYSLQLKSIYKVNSGYRTEEGAEDSESKFVQETKASKRVNYNCIRRVFPMTKHIITADGSFEISQGEPFLGFTDKIPFSDISEYAQLSDDGEIKRLSRECDNFNIEGSVNFVSSRLQDVELYRQETKDFIKSVKGKTQSEKKTRAKKEEGDAGDLAGSSTVESVEVDGIWPQTPDKDELNIYFYYTYTIKTVYRGREYVAEISPDGKSPYAPEVEYSAEAKQKIAKAQGMFSKKRKRAILSAAACSLMLLIMFIVGAALKNDYAAKTLPQSYKWAQTIALTPAAIADVAVIALIAVAAIVYGVAISSQIKREGMLEDKKRRSATRGTRTVKALVFYILVLTGIALVTVQFVAWIILAINAV